MEIILDVSLLFKETVHNIHPDSDSQFQNVQLIQCPVKCRQYFHLNTLQWSDYNTFHLHQPQPSFHFLECFHTSELQFLDKSNIWVHYLNYLYFGVQFWYNTYSEYLPNAIQQMKREKKNQNFIALFFSWWSAIQIFTALLIRNSIWGYLDNWKSGWFSIKSRQNSR